MHSYNGPFEQNNHFELRFWDTLCLINLLSVSSLFYTNVGLAQSCPSKQHSCIMNYKNYAVEISCTTAMIHVWYVSLVQPLHQQLVTLSTLATESIVKHQGGHVISHQKCLLSLCALSGTTVGRSW